jgi:hypothetical protein
MEPKKTSRGGITRRRISRARTCNADGIGGEGGPKDGIETRGAAEAVSFASSSSSSRHSGRKPFQPSSPWQAGPLQGAVADAVGQQGAAPGVLPACGRGREGSERVKGISKERIIRPRDPDIRLPARREME